jgi:hypothetical protein
MPLPAAKHCIAGLRTYPFPSQYLTHPPQRLCAPACSYLHLVRVTRAVERPTPWAHPLRGAAIPAAGMKSGPPPPPVVVNPRAVLQNAFLAPVAATEQQPVASALTVQRGPSAAEGLLGQDFLAVSADLGASLGGGAGVSADKGGRPLSMPIGMGRGPAAASGRALQAEADQEEENGGVGGHVGGGAQSRPSIGHDDDAFYDQQISNGAGVSAKRQRMSGTGVVAGRQAVTPGPCTRISGAAGSSRLGQNPSGMAAGAAAAAVEEEDSDEDDENEAAELTRGGTRGSAGFSAGMPQRPCVPTAMGGLLSMSGLPIGSMAPAIMGPDPLTAQQIMATQQMIAAQQMQLPAANPLMAAGMLGGMGAVSPLGLNPLAAQLQMQAAADAGSGSGPGCCCSDPWRADVGPVTPVDQSPGSAAADAANRYIQ